MKHAKIESDSEAEYNKTLVTAASTSTTTSRRNALSSSLLGVSGSPPAAWQPEVCIPRVSGYVQVRGHQIVPGVPLLLLVLTVPPHPRYPPVLFCHGPGPGGTGFPASESGHHGRKLKTRNSVIPISQPEAGSALRHES
eukprot:473483-Rhodomonas_salina.2